MPARELTFPDPVDDPRDLFDRDEPARRLRSVLGSKASRAVVIVGGRLIGKTSLLNVVTRWAEREGSFVVVKLAHAGSRDELMAEIMHGIREKVGSDGSAGPDRLEPDRTSGLTIARFVKIVQNLTDGGAGRRFLLCIDEFDTLLEGCTDAEARQIQYLVLHLIEKTTLPIRFLFTISRVPDRVRLSYGSPFINQATIVELRPWSATESQHFVEWLLDGRLRLDPAAHAVLYRAAGGHPYFTKAVLDTMLHEYRAGPDGIDVPPADVLTAVRATVRSRRVSVALSNIAEVHLTDAASRVLEKAAANPMGLTAREVRDLNPASGDLDALTELGLLAGDGRRYWLRLGLWRTWRAENESGATAYRSRQLAAVGRILQRVVGGRAVKSALLVSFVVLVLTLILGWLVFVRPSHSRTAGPCTGAAHGLRVQVTYPRYVSPGDQQSLDVRVSNDGASVDDVSGSAVVSFPPAPSGQVSVNAGNSINFDALRPGEQQTLVVVFSYDEPGRILPAAGSRVPAELRVSVAGGSCSSVRWSMSVAPVPHLRDLRNYAFGLMAVVVIPLLIELLVRSPRRQRGDPAHGPKPAVGPPAPRR